MTAVIGVDGLGGDALRGAPPHERAIEATRLIDLDGITYHITVPENVAGCSVSPAVLVPVRSPSESIEYFVSQNLPFVSGFNIQHGMQEIITHLIPGIRRVPFAIEFPSRPRGTTLFLDVGCNSDLCDIVDASQVPPSRQYQRKAEHIVGFARLGALYMELLRGVQQPRVGLLCNGIEKTKGNAFVRACHAALSRESCFDYAGFTEPTSTATVDVLVTEGYTGNIALKFIEETVRVCKDQLGLFGKVLRLLGIGATTSKYAAALTLGLRSLIIKVHGEATAEHYATAYRKMREFTREVTVPSPSSPRRYPDLASAICAEYQLRHGRKE